MLALILFCTCLFVACGFGVLAAWSDIKGMTIPNTYSVYIIAAFAVCFVGMWGFGHADVFSVWWSHLLAGVVIFGLTAPLFFYGIMGAADSKLATAFSFWLSLKGIFPFLVYTALAGGLLALACLVLKKFKPVKNPLEGSWVAQVQDGADKVPYGVAITIGALASFAKIGYVDLSMFALFVAP